MIEVGVGFNELTADTPLDMSLNLLQRQDEQLEPARLILDVLRQHGGLIHRMAINLHDHRIRRAHHQALQESLEDRSHDEAAV